MVSQSPARLQSLTGLRFFAALWVICYHQTSNWLERVTALSPAPIRNLLHTGYVSVGFFFVLSGFVLAHSQHRPGAAIVPTSKLKFWWARATRIVPLYWLGLLLAAPFAYRIALATHVKGGHVFLAESFAAASTMQQAWFPDFATVWNPPGWSLSAEVFFYLCFPFFAPPVLRLERRPLLMLMFALFALGMLPPLVAYLRDIPRFGRLPAIFSPEPASGPWVRGVAFSPLFRLTEFIFGIALCRLRVLAEGRPLARRSRNWALGIIAAAFAALAFAAPYVPYPFLHNGLLMPVWALVILVFADAAPNAWLGGRVLVLLGEASYGMYILHFPVLAWLRALLRPLERVINHVPEAMMVVYLVVVTSSAVASFLFFESPLRRKLQNLQQAR
jgi:peptidoglycan/LPS O-acetylase OafA/YrhL